MNDFYPTVEEVDKTNSIFLTPISTVCPALRELGKHVYTHGVRTGIFRWLAIPSVIFFGNKCIKYGTTIHPWEQKSILSADDL